MILLDKNTTNNIFAVTLWEHRVDYLGADSYTLTLSNDSTKTEYQFTLTDSSSYPYKYNQFTLSNEDLTDLPIGWYTYMFSDEDGDLESGRCYIKGNELQFNVSEVYK